MTCMTWFSVFVLVKQFNLFQLTLKVDVPAAKAICCNTDTACDQV